MAKANIVKIVSPPCGSAYAWLSKPDEGQEYSDGKYKVTLLLDKDSKETQSFIKELDAKCDEAAQEKWNGMPKKLSYPYKDGDEKDNEDFAGKWMLTAKTKFKPGTFDCSAPPTPLPEGSEPASGDLIKASFSLFCYETGGKKGVSAQLRNVQLIEKRNLSSSSMSDFDGVEGGYTAAQTADVFEDDDDF